VNRNVAPTDPRSSAPGNLLGWRRLRSALQSAIEYPLQSSPDLLQQALETFDAPFREHEADARFACIEEFTRLCYLANASRQALDPLLDGAKQAAALGNMAKRRVLLTFLGIMQADSGNLPAALTCICEALEISDSLHDTSAAAIVLNNLTTLLIYGELPHLAEQAIEAMRESLQVVVDPDLRERLRTGMHVNEAWAALYTGHYSKGLRAGRKAVEATSHLELMTPWLVILRSASIGNFGHLLLRVRDLQPAEQFIPLAASLLQEPRRSDRSIDALEAFLGLYDTYAGDAPKGIERLIRCKERTVLRSSGHEATSIRLLIEAYEVAGKTHEASTSRLELAAFVQRAGFENALFHHERHLREKLGIQGARVQSAGAPRAIAYASRSQTLLARTEVLEGLSAAAELQDDPSGEHPFRVAKLSELLAEMLGLPPHLVTEISVAARLHDIGKVGTPIEVLREPGPLSAEAASVMKQHTTLGAEILASAGLEDVRVAIEVAKHHHERWDGSGYPDGLSGEAIPLAARIVAVCEAFDAMTHDRVYRPKLSIARTLDLISSHSGRHFDPSMTPMFCSLIERIAIAHRDLDEYLAREARCTSPFLRTKYRMTQGLAKSVLVS
jgi:putative nucleotidyltransferase with HDIG domain